MPLITLNDACNLGENAGLDPAGYAENISSWYIIPQLVSLDASIQLFYVGSVLLAFVAKTRFA